MKNLQHTQLLFILYLLIIQGQGFPSGAPPSTCETFLPLHGIFKPQITSLPYEILVEPRQFKSGEKIKVNIVDPKGESLKGIIIGVFKKTNTLGSNVGEFVQFPTEKLHPLTCTEGLKNSVLTHSNDKNVHNISLVWKAPDEATGDVIVRLTLVENYNTFWYDVQITLVSKDAIDVTEPSTTEKASEVSPLVTAIDFSTCGESKGCFLYPTLCSGEDCLAALTYTYRRSTNDFLIEMMSNSKQNYVALGLSDDKYVGGGDEVFTCMAGDNGNVIQHGYSAGFSVVQLKMQNQISSQEVTFHNGRLECRFIVPDITFGDGIHGNDGKIYHHTDEMYAQIAWGSILPKSFVMLKHDDMPAQSDNKINLGQCNIHRGSAFSIPVRGHGVFMTIAWVFLCGLAIAIARHFKDVLPDVEVVGTKVWFQLHRGLAVATLILTTAGITFVFGHYGFVIRQSAVPHAYVGLTVVAVVHVQILWGIFRPSLKHEYRWLFNGCHRMIGIIVHILAAITIMLAFRIEYFTYEMKRLGVIAVGLWMAIQIIWHVVFELYSIHTPKIPMGPETEPMLTGMMLADERKYPIRKSKCFTQWLVLTIYTLMLLACCLFLIIVFLSY